jgi:hypothetical protein
VIVSHGVYSRPVPIPGRAAQSAASAAVHCGSVPFGCLSKSMSDGLTARTDALARGEESIFLPLGDCQGLQVNWLP